MDCSPPGSSVHGIRQARILEWVATPFSRESFRLRNQILISCVSCIGRWVLYHQHQLGYPLGSLICVFLLSALYLWVSLVAQLVKNLSAMQETWVQSLVWEDSLENEMATHSSILAWRIPWTEAPGGLQSRGSQRVGHNWATKHSTQYLWPTSSCFWSASQSNKQHQHCLLSCYEFRISYLTLTC